MSRRGAGHEEFRELISTRLDAPLPRHLQRQLAKHLATCTACRSVQSDYLEQRRMLRSLPTVPPPRDLWARTSAGLDRELARRPARGVGPGRDARVPGAAVIGSAGALAVALVLGSVQLGAAPDAPQATAHAGQATPFSIEPQSISFVGSSSYGLVLYRTELDHVCPTSALRCTEEEGTGSQLIALPANARPASLSVSPDGELLAITAHQRGMQGVFAVVLRQGAGPHSVPLRSAEPTRPSSAPAAQRPDDLAPPVNAPGSVVASPTASPASATSGAAPPGRTPGPGRTAWAAATPVPGGSPHPGDTAAPVAGTEPDGSAQPSLSARSTPPPADPSVLPPSWSPSPSEALLPSLATVAVVEDVLTAGAPAAWSPDGSLLAFSAMPGDGSHGPDVYVWRPGEQARQLTSDHRSYFASWAAGEIVASRLTRPPGNRPEPGLQTIAIDPETGAERELNGPVLWLPAVNPQGTLAVGWQGELELSGSALEPRRGALYLAAWPAPDVTREDASSSAEPASPQLDADSPRPDALDEPADGNAGASPPVEDSADEESAAPSGTPFDAGGGREASEPYSGEADRLLPIEPERDALEQPVTDWLVKWSPDGESIGYWVADSAGATWGHLGVLTIDAETRTPDHDQPLLRPTLARRTFTLDKGRVAWVAPAEGQLEGEVRLMVWGGTGAGGLTLPSLDLREVVPAF